MGGETVKIAGLKQGYPDLRIDSYQRASSWDDSLRAAFVVSVIQDWPTGIIVLNRIEDKSRAPSLAASHDIIDGQQRLSTVFDFIENPLIYVYRWAPRKKDEDEPQILTELRDDFLQLAKQLRRKGSGYVHAGKKLDQVKQKIFEEAGIQLKRQLADDKAPFDQYIGDLVRKMLDLLHLVSQRSLVVQELKTETVEAERMYRAINTHGKIVEWWELLRASRFNEISYQGSLGEDVRYTAMTSRLAGLYFAKNKKIRPREVSDSPTIWDALFAVGECYHCYLAGEDPMSVADLVSKDRRKVKVDGLGFRLVTGFLTHEISRVRIDKIIDEFDEGTISKAADCLLDTAEALFVRPGHFKLFAKYSAFGAEVIPAYPLMCLILAAAHMLAKNPATRNLNDPQKESLRLLAEELFRESICTDKWVGSGDSKLKEWLEKYFFSSTAPNQLARTSTPTKPFPGDVKAITSSYDQAVWGQFVEKAKPVSSRSVPKEWQYFHFLVQYLYDSKINGCLPQGGVSYDHIVKFNGADPRTSHPYNFCAIRADLNLKKGGQSYVQWGPTGLEQKHYELQSQNGLSLQVGAFSIRTPDFLANASAANLASMIEQRTGLIKFALTKLLPRWTSDGD